MEVSMFLKSNMRPAMAGVGGPDIKQSRKLTSMMFSNGAAESADFGAFGDEPERPAPSQNRGGRNKKGGFKLDKKTLIIAAIAAVAVVVVAAVLGVALFSGDGNIRYENNAYMAYVDSQDNYRIVSNGELLEETFEGNLKLIPAADNSFAYVIHEGEDNSIYILKGKELTLVSDNVEKYITSAGLKPGVVFSEISNSGKTNYVHYYNGYTASIVKGGDSPEDFIISDDGSIVVYTISGKDAADRVPYIFDEVPEKAPIAKNSIPVAISRNGKYVYSTYQNKDGETVLAVTDLKSEETYDVPNSVGFYGVLEMNVKGDEVIFCTKGINTETAEEFATSYLYRHNASDDECIVKLGDNFITSVKIDPEIAIYKSFADKYFETTAAFDSDAKLKTYYLSKKYEMKTISDFKGMFDPDGDYFYCLDDGDLLQFDLSDMDSRKGKTIESDVLDFTVTKKGNLYYLDEDYLTYGKVISAKKPRPSRISDVTAFSYHRGSNKIYYSIIENPVVYMSEESNDQDVAKFGSTELSALPYFSSQTDGKCYAVVQDENSGKYTVYYSSNGNSFKAINDINDCASIAFGITIPEDLEW